MITSIKLKRIFWEKIKLPFILKFQQDKIYLACLKSSLYIVDNNDLRYNMCEFNLAQFANAAKLYNIDVRSGDGYYCRKILDNCSFVKKCSGNNYYYRIV